MLNPEMVFDPNSPLTWDQNQWIIHVACTQTKIVNWARATLESVGQETTAMVWVSVHFSKKKERNRVRGTK